MLFESKIYLVATLPNIVQVLSVLLSILAGWWWQVTDDWSWTMLDLPGIQRIYQTLTSLSIPPTPRELLQSIDFYFYEEFFSYHKTIPYMGFQFFVPFLMWKDCNSLDIPRRGELSCEEDNSFFTGQIRGDINKPERRPIKTDIKKRTPLTGSTSKQLSASAFHTSDSLWEEGKDKDSG